MNCIPVVRRAIVLDLAALLAASFAFGQEGATARLEKSTRHQEWVTVKSGERNVHSFVVFPEKKEKAAALVVIHENRGLTDWVRGVADQLAEAGYIAIAPDLLSGMAPGGGKTSDFPSSDAAREAIYALPPAQVTADLTAVAAYVRALPACNGKVAVAGFCWGGAQSFRFATAEPKLAAAFVFYGTGPEDPAAFASIGCPVYGFYGEDDARVDATIPATTELMKKAAKKYEPATYAGAGHGFMREGEEPTGTPANKKARDDAWKRWKSLLAKL